MRVKYMPADVLRTHPRLSVNVRFHAFQETGVHHESWSVSDSGEAGRTNSSGLSGVSCGLPRCAFQWPVLRGHIQGHARGEETEPGCTPPGRPGAGYSAPFEQSIGKSMGAGDHSLHVGHVLPAGWHDDRPGFAADSLVLCTYT